MSPCAGVGTSYTEALVGIREAARAVRTSRREPDASVRVTLAEAVGCVVAQDCTSPTSTPEHDTSAMDGYALCSEMTKGATLQQPVYFEVRGTIAAGDDPSAVTGCRLAGEISQDAEPCVEIMTGARFPTSGPGRHWDACVRVEDVTRVDGKGPSGFDSQNTSVGTRIAITKPVPPRANRRIAGEDVKKGDVLLKAGTIIRSSHLLPLASVGIQSVLVRSKPSVGVWSTGNELLSGPASVPDVNGLYLASASRELNADATFLGVLEDTAEAIALTISQALETRQDDVLITSGGVSVGKFDHVRKALDLAGADIVFHGLAIRPGHPVLFALLPSRRGKVAFFGLPGNPGAAATCFRFIVVPYLRSWMGQDAEHPVTARLEVTKSSDDDSNGKRHRPLCPGRDVFRPGLLRVMDNGENICSEVSQRHSPSLLAPYVNANCWMHFKQDYVQGSHTLVECYPTFPGTAG